jgi:hypothetical protein
MVSPQLSAIPAAPEHWTSRCAPSRDFGPVGCSFARPRLADVNLSLTVSQDEEHVRLRVHWGGKAFDLGERNHNYLLLTLARRRLEDERAGLPAAASGWIHCEEFEHDESMIGARLNMGVFRLRRQFAALGLSDGARIVERRTTASQLRIGTSRVSVFRLGAASRDSF